MGNYNNHANYKNTNFGKLKTECFQAIQESMKSALVHNHRNKVNIAISMNKVEFSNERHSLRMPLDTNQNFISWKEYLLQYLRKEVQIGHLWAIQLHYTITSQDFTNECIWLNLFFYHEYNIMTKPQCLNSIKNISDIIPEVNASDNVFENNFMGSFASNNNDPQDLNNASFQYKNFKNFIKQYIDIFQQHIFDLNHPINNIISAFEKEFSPCIIEAKLKIKEHKSKANQDKILSSIIKQLQKFIVEITVVVKLFYCRAISYQFFVEEKDEFNNLVTTLVFKTGKLYLNMFQLFEEFYQKDINAFRNKLDQFKDINPDEVGIEKQFRLDQSTKAYQLELIEMHRNEKKSDELYIDNKNAENKIINIDNKKKKGPSASVKAKLNEKNSNKFKPNTQKNNLIDVITNQDDFDSFNKDIKIVSESQKLVQFSSSNKKINYGIPIGENSKPFEVAINLLKTFNTFNAPFEKIMAIATISAEITDSVNLYWKEMKKIIPQSLLKIGADQLMTIYLYIIIKAQLPNLIIHLAFANHFTSSKTKSFSSIGYYFTTFEGCINYILEMKEHDRSKKIGSGNYLENSIGSINY